MEKPANRESDFSNVLKRSAKNLPSLSCPMLEDAELAEEMGRGRAHQCERSLCIMRRQLPMLCALIHVARD